MTDNVHVLDPRVNAARLRGNTYRAMLEDTAELIDMVTGRPNGVPSEEDHEALVFQSQAIRTILKDDKP